MRRNIGGFVLLYAERRDLEEPAVSLLDSVMRNDRTFASDQFCGGIAEHRGIAQGKEFFDDREFGALFREDQIARVVHRWNVATDAYEKQVNRCFQNRPSTNVKERTILHKGCIQGAERIALDFQVAAQMWLKVLRFFGNLRSEVYGKNAWGQTRKRGEFWREMTVHKDHAGRCAWNPAGFDLIAKREKLLCSQLLREPKLGFRDGRNASEAPVLNVRSGEAGLRKLRKGVFAKFG
jgi:hypothetical protein